MLKFLGVAVVLLAGSSLGANAGETKLSGVEIEALLPTIIARGEATRQVFSDTGSTTHSNRGRDSFGRWRVQDDQYCSQWPPSGNWTCYDVILVEGAPETIIWIDALGGQTRNEFERRE